MDQASVDSRPQSEGVRAFILAASRFTLPSLILLVAVALVLLYVGYDLVNAPDADDQASPFSANVALFSALLLFIRFAYDFIHRKIGTIEVISADILSIGRTIYYADLIGDFGRALTNPNKVSLAGFGDTPRAEDYFSTFEKSIDGIRDLQTQISRDIVSFYALLRGSRDAAGALARWGSPDYGDEQKKVDLAKIIFFCFLICMRARIMFGYLIIDRRHRLTVCGLFYFLQFEALFYLDQYFNEEGKQDRKMLFFYGEYEKRRKGLVDTCGKEKDEIIDLFKNEIYRHAIITSALAPAAR